MKTKTIEQDGDFWCKFGVSLQIYTKMLFERSISAHLEVLRKYYPIISLTGPRQAGKTTLLKAHFNDFRYINFEIPKERLAFREDPLGFLATYDDKVIFDEAQYVPDLFSYLQVNVDEDRRPGRFILSGSQDFLLRKNIGQSLAGRVGIARLLPYDFKELRVNDVQSISIEEAIFNGFYPGRLKEDLPPDIFYSSYLYSYVQRDVAEFVNASNLSLFDRFLQVVAGSVGQLVNYSSMATVVGVGVKTIQSWISILEQSYVLFRLPPYFKNVSRRLVKSPKLYFYDTGLLCYLLGLRAPAELRSYHLYGNLFENMVVADAFKQTLHKGERPLFNFYRDSHGKEIDLVFDTPAKQVLWEIKATQTFHPRLIRPLNKIADVVFPQATRRLVYGGDDDMTLNEVGLTPWNTMKW